jgi:uncharacterized protein (DUF2235 family)
MATSGRNLVVLSDGTGNSSAKAQRTNVWRMFEALDQTQTNQIAMYDDGVGTSSNKYLAGLGGAFGFGLKRNVLDLYKFLCRNYRVGDRIYGFGFSRGAFTIRILVGLVACEGLVQCSSDEELDRYAAAAYRAFRAKNFKRWSPIVWISRGLRDVVLWLRDRIGTGASYAEVTKLTKPPITFLGLWDTVEAYGMPNQELKRAIDRFVWPLLFGEFDLSPIVERACHALSLDDERTTFHPLLWDEVAEAARVIEARNAPQAATAHNPPAGRITQVWFAGVHSNVGGGYPEDQLSLVSLYWIMGEAQKRGLNLSKEAVERVKVARSPYARLYDSRKGLASYYRYAPRRIEVLRDAAGTRIWPIVDSSVVMRMAYGSDGYAPLSLPHQFWVLDSSGDVVPLKGNVTLERDAAKPEKVTPQSKDAELVAAMQLLENPDYNTIRFVWDTVFWRRCLYFLTVALTVWLAAFPLMPHLPKGTLNTIARGPLSNIVEALSVLIPSFAQPWKQALIEHPLEFGGLALLILLCMRGSTLLEQRTHDRARLAWRDDVAAAVNGRGKPAGSARSGRLFVGLLALLAVFGGAVVWDASEEMLALIGVATGVVAIRLLIRVLAARAKRSAAKQTGAAKRSLGRALRTNGTLRRVYSFSANTFVPFVFVIALGLGALLLVNGAAFDIASSAGAYCEPTPGLSASEERVGKAKAQFQNDMLCWPSGLVLMAGQRYLITVSTERDDTVGEGDSTVSTEGDWFDKNTRADPTGFASDSAIYYAASPLKRWWSGNWMQTIARIGELGNDEYLLEPIDDVRPWKHAPCVDDAQQQDTAASIRAKIDPALERRLLACDPTPKDRLVVRSEIVARSSGELFLHVNDVVLAGTKRWASLFVANNSGTARVEVRRLPRSPFAVEPTVTPTQLNK